MIHYLLVINHCRPTSQTKVINKWVGTQDTVRPLAGLKLESPAVLYRLHVKRMFLLMWVDEEFCGCTGSCNFMKWNVLHNFN
jgi:hypothetical protein